jgi:hypothetical protein
VYSASVIHVIGDEAKFRQYLHNVCSTLVTGGIFFGSTLGVEEDRALPPDRHGSLPAPGLWPGPGIA